MHPDKGSKHVKFLMQISYPIQDISLSKKSSTNADASQGSTCTARSQYLPNRRAKKDHFTEITEL